MKPLSLTAKFMCAVMMCLLPTSLVMAAPTKIVHLSGTYPETPYGKFLIDRMAAFHAMYPDVEVEFVLERGSAAYTEKALTMIAGGSALDVLDQSDSFTVLSARDLLADLTPYAKAENVNLDRNMFAFAKQTVVYNGKLIGIPNQLSAVVASYNRTLLDELGIPPLSVLGDNWSWNWLRNYASRLTIDKNGDGTPETWAVRYDPGYSAINAWFHQAGGNFFDTYIHPQKAALNSMPVRQALSFIIDMLNSKWMVNGAGNFFTQRGGAIYLCTSPQNSINVEQSSDKFELIRQPKGPVRGGGSIALGPYHVPSMSKQKEWAFRWIKFLALSEATQGAMLSANLMPAYPPVVTHLEPYLANVPAKTQEFFLQLRDAAMDPDNYPRLISAAEAEISKLWNGEWNNVAAGKTPLNNFIDTMQTQIQAALDNNWAAR